MISNNPVWRYMQLLYRYAKRIDANSISTVQGDGTTLLASQIGKTVTLSVGDITSVAGSSLPYFIELTDATSPYDWKHVEPDGSGGWDDHPDAATGTDDAYEMNGADGLAIGTIGLMVDKLNNIFIVAVTKVAWDGTDLTYNIGAVENNVDTPQAGCCT